ncbi:ABC transporter permease [Candidatus Woesearchaeota archaeon]|nr:ABC transporter permease [Candidatus Woesearchaeota archaeon]
MWNDYFKLAFKTFITQKKRTALTLIGIFIGIAAVVSLISLGQGLKYSIDKQFDLMGTDKIFIMPGQNAGMDPTNTLRLTNRDADAINSVSGVDSVTISAFKIAQVEFGGEILYTWSTGIGSDESNFEEMIESFGVEIDKGRGAKGLREVVIGHRFRIGDIFDKPVDIGDRLVIEGKKFKVVGSVNEIGNPQDDSQTYITFEAAKDVFDLPDDELDFIFVTTKDGSDPSEVAEKIKKKLRKLHDVKEGEEDFTVQTADDFMEAFGIVLTIVQIVLVGIAGISLLVGGVNIANTMYTAVLERTNEIGIMKAIGARNKDIFLIFLIESGILGLTGGIVGIIVGIGMSKLVEFGAHASGWNMVQTIFPPYLTLGALAFSFIVGTAAGTLPAYQASKMKPVDALRYE